MKANRKCSRTTIQNESSKRMIIYKTIACNYKKCPINQCVSDGNSYIKKYPFSGDALK
jgi:hypothetical protein